MAQQRAIGNWNWRPARDESSLAAVPDNELPRPPTRRPTSVDPEPPSEPLPGPKRTERGMAFFLGVLVGLVPLIAVIGGLVGYLIARDGGDGQTVTTGSPVSTAAPASESTADEPASPVAGAPAANSSATTAQPASPTPTADLVAPSAEIGNGVVTIEGTLNAAAAETYIREFTLLADALGYELVGQPTIDQGAPAMAEVSVRFDDLFFDPDSDHLDHEFLPLLDAVAAYLTQGSTSLTIVSHTDASGSDASNIHLAQHRAGAVFEYLVDQGVAAGRLRIDPRGESEASGATGSDAQSDRRVEFVLEFAQ